MQHIVAICIHIVASDLVHQLRFRHEFGPAYSLPGYGARIRITAIMSYKLILCLLALNQLLI